LTNLKASTRRGLAVTGRYARGEGAYEYDEDDGVVDAVDEDCRRASGRLAVTLASSASGKGSGGMRGMVVVMMIMMMMMMMIASMVMNIMVW
jgi:hypothetical protein